jgi:hypothetical protein
MYLITISFQVVTTTADLYTIFSSIGRENGPQSPPTTSAINLATGSAFSVSGSEVSAAAFLMGGSATTINTPISNVITFVDTPNTGSYTYSVRVLSNMAITINQFYINVIQIRA